MGLLEEKQIAEDMFELMGENIQKLMIYSNSQI
jgi:hypothetical protein